MPINRTFLAAAVAAGLALSVDASAQNWRHGGPQGFGQILAAVQLSAAQKQQVHSIMSSAHAQNAPLMTQLQALRSQLEATLFSTGDVTAAQLMPMQQQLESLRAQLDASRIQTALAIRNVLTAAQLAHAASVQSQLSSLHQQEHALMIPAASE